MKLSLTLKTVTGGSTVYEVEDTDTVGQLKEQLGGEYDLATLKLCSKGKVLEDQKTFQDLGFSPSETLIIAGKKKTIPTPAPAHPAPTATAKSPQQVPSAPLPAQPKTSAPTTTSAPAPASAPAPTSAPPSSQPSQAHPSQPPQPQVDENIVSEIMAMGFDDRNQVIRALRCAYMNPDRAVEYLFNGIPPAVLAQFEEQHQRARPAATSHVAPAPAQPPSQPASQPAPQQAAGNAAMTADQLQAMLNAMQQQGPQTGSQLEQALQAIPHFEQIRTLVQQNPAALPAVMGQLQQHNPELFAMVQQNPQEFLDIMNRGSAGGAAGRPAQAGPQVMQLTPADQEPINRLVQLGGGMWDARAATIVYLACQRNEEMAANVLFDNGGLPPELADVEMQEGEGPQDE